MADGTREGGRLVPAQAGKLKAFVSYSRDDLDFADQLVAALELCGFEATIDRHGISGGEAWQQRLGALILEADTVVFVLSPSSARSDICSWEVEEATRRGKRILPVLARPLDGASPPARLQDLNYVFFYADTKSPGSGFGAGLTALVEALNTDLGWIREHTRLLERATEWDAVGRPASRLLSGSDVVEAKAWAGRRPRGAPEPTAMHFEFIRASEEEEARRASAERKRLDEMAAAQEERAKALKAAEEAQRAGARARAMITWGSVAAGAVILVTLAGWLVRERHASAEQARLAQEADEQAKLARKLEQEAKDRADDIKIDRSRLLLDLARNEERKGDQVTAILLALEAEPPKETMRAARLMVDAQELLSSSLQALRERAVLKGHTALVWGVAITSNGNHIVTGAWGRGQARLWDSTTGNEIRRFDGHAADVNGVAVTPDGSRVATASDDGTARIWDASTGKELKRLTGHSSIVYGIAVTPDGSRVITGSADRTARIWDAATGGELHKLKGHEDVVFGVAVTPDGRLVVTASKDKTVRIWDPATGEGLKKLVGHDDAVYGVAVTADGSRVVTGSADQTVRVWDAATAKELLRLRTDGRVSAVAIANEGTRIFANSHDLIKVWDSHAGKVLTELKGHGAAIRGLAVTPDGALAVTGADDRTARVWDTRASFAQAVLKGHAGRVWGLAVAPNGTRIVTGAWGDAPARVWDAQTGKELFKLIGHAGDVNGVAVMPDSKRIVTVSDDTTARIWDADTGKELRRLVGHKGIVYGVAVTRDGKRIVTGSADRTARIWDSETGKELRLLKGHDDEINVVVMLDSTRVVTGSDDKTVRVWDINTGAEVLPQPLRHGGPVFGIAVTLDGNRIVTGSVDGTARIWDAATGAEILQLRGHTGAVNGVAVTPDGAFVITGSQDNTARIWDASTGKELHAFRGHTADVFGVAVAPDGSRLYTGSFDNTVRVWGLAELRPATRDLADRAKKEVPRCLTILQRQSFRLGPTPPRWCLDAAKYPFHAPAWSKGSRDPTIAGEFNAFAMRALLDGDFGDALEAAKRSIEYDPTEWSLRINQAHALMFLAKSDEARSVYLELRGKKRDRPTGVLRRMMLTESAEEMIRSDFEKLRKRGFNHPQMGEIEKLLKEKG